MQGRKRDCRLPRIPASRRWPRDGQHARKGARAGAYVLRASHTDWGLERVARTYRQLTEIEATFPSLPSEISLRCRRSDVGFSTLARK